MSSKCYICLNKLDRAVICGQFMSHRDIDVHYFCLLSSPIPQNGNIRSF